MFKRKQGGFVDAESVVGVVVFFLVVGLIATLIGAAISDGKKKSAEAKNAVQTSNDISKQLDQSVPIPQLTTSLERKNVAKRAELFSSEDKISYIYLISYGKVMTFYPVKGKVSSLRSYMSPVDKLIDNKGENCDGWDATGGCYVVEAPDIDGTYGENADGIFFFTTEGAYVEWKGEYMMSDQPLQLATPPALVREIK
jgi:hypothetical protein